jgi:hypothetical protein
MTLIYSINNLTSMTVLQALEYFLYNKSAVSEEKIVYTLFIRKRENGTWKMLLIVSIRNEKILWKISPTLFVSIKLFRLVVSEILFNVSVDQKLTRIAQMATMLFLRQDEMKIFCRGPKKRISCKDSVQCPQVSDKMRNFNNNGRTRSDASNKTNPLSFS